MNFTGWQNTIESVEKPDAADDDVLDLAGPAANKWRTDRFCFPQGLLGASESRH